MWKRQWNITNKSASFEKEEVQKVQKVIYWSYYIDNLNFKKNNNKKLWQGDEACPLIKQGRSKLMNIEEKIQAKGLTIQFHLHLLTNNEWLADFSRYCTFNILLLL